MLPKRKAKIKAAIVASLFFVVPLHAEALKQISLDYAYYSPESLVVKKNHWLEDEFNKSHTRVKWVLSRGSNNSLEFVNSGATDFALTSSISAFVSRANGQPVKAIYSYLWYVPSLILVQKNSPYKSLQELKGKKSQPQKGQILTSFCYELSVAATLMLTMSISFIFSILKVGQLWSRVGWMPGQDWIHLWRRDS